MATSLAQHGCLVGVTCLPGYDRIEPWIKHPNGFTLDEIVAACGGGMHALVAQSEVDISERELTCIFHDWGCVYGLVQVNRVLEENILPLCPKQVVLFDVCGPPHPEVAKMKGIGNMSIWSSVKIFTYQFFFASCFALQKHISVHLANLYYTVGCMALFNILPFWPCGPQDKALMEQRHPMPPVRKIIHMMYPYYYTMRQGSGSFYKQFHLPKADATRVLYMYGLNKNVMFHSPGVVQYLEEQDPTQAKAIAVEGAGHWLYLQREDYCLQAVLDFCFGSNKKVD
jgi:hypothetical protein